MALQLFDRVQVAATANTTVSFTLGSAVAGYQSFATAGVTNGNTVYYGSSDGTNWEVGIGTYSTTGPTLTRTTILSSSNSGSAVTFSGSPNVWIDYPSSKAVYLDANGNIAWNNEAPGYTTYAATGQTITLTATATYYQHFSGTGVATLKLPDETTIGIGAAYIIDNDSTSSITVQDSAANLLATVTPGMAGYIYSLSNSSSTGNWAGYAFVPGSGPSSAITWGTSGLSMGGGAISSAGTITGTNLVASNGLIVNNKTVGSFNTYGNGTLQSSGTTTNIATNSTPLYKIGRAHV